MKKIIFKNLSVKNFLSIGSKPVTLDFTSGINLITGVNLDKEDASNGSGKSSLISAIYFCLYGRALKDLKIDQIPNSYTKGTCEVVIDLDVIQDHIKKEYKIKRTLRPSRLTLSEDGNDITKSTMVQTSELLQGIINCSSTVFENSIVMDANNATSFMSQKKVEKRKFLEGILNLGVFGEMLSIARNDYNTTKYEYDIQLTKIQEQNKVLDTYKQQEQKQSELIQSRREDINSKIAQIEQNVSDITKTYKDVLTQEQADDLQDKSTKLKDKSKQSEVTSRELYVKKSQLQHRMSDLSKELKRLKALPDVCNECERPFTEQDKTTATTRCDNINADIESLKQSHEQAEQDIKSMEVQSQKITQALSAISKKIIESRDNQKHNDQIDWKINQLNETLSSLQKDLTSVQEQTNMYEQLVKDLSAEIEQIQNTANEINIKLETLQAAKFILSEEGIRSYIVKKILRILNSKLNMYLSKLDANTRCEFNEYFEETLWDQYNNERSYHNFSSGEQRRIDLAILFAFQDIRRLQADVSMNISIYDELLDSSLDKKGTELVMFLLRERADKNNECVYIVSHKKEAQTSYITRMITLQKKNGITTLAS